MYDFVATAVAAAAVIASRLYSTMQS